MSGSSEPGAAGTLTTIATGTAAPTTTVVDFGTASVRAAVVAGGTSWLVPEPLTGSPNWPAAAHWDGTRLRVGSLAARARGEDPDGYWAELTRMLTVDAAVSQGGRTFRPIELFTAVLRAVTLEAQRLHGAVIDRLLLTVPAGHPPAGRHRAAMVTAAEAAGVNTVELLAEPVAAVCAIGLAPGGLVLVCDLGAGSFDLTLVRVADDPQVVGADAVTGAGRDLDATLEERIYADGQAWLAPLITEANQDPGGSAAVRLGLALGDLAQRLKHRLSNSPVAQDVMLPHTPAYALTRDDLAAAAGPTLARTVARAERLLRQCGCTPADLAAVLLTGGGARMPVVTRRFAEAFGHHPHQLAEPELTVVHGAARWVVRRGRPSVVSEALPAGTVPLAFAIPGGRAELVRWLVAPGQWFDAGMALARVRLPTGALWELTASVPGTLRRVLAVPRTEITAYEWLALAVQ